MYEVWDITASNSRRLSVSEIELDEIEVKTQVRRFLKIEKGRPAAASSGNFFDEEMLLHFPVAIGSRVNTFTILRTIFHCDYELLHSLRYGQTEVIQWQEYCIPVEADIFELFTKASCYAEANTVLQSRRCAQSYRFSTCLNGRYLLYQSLDGFDYLIRSEDSASSVKVYEFEVRKEGLLLKELGSIAPGQYCLANCSFHPYLPLLLFGVRGWGLCIGIWCFTSTTHVGKPVVDEKYPLCKLNTDGLMHFIQKSSGDWCGSLEILQFSACGKQIIVKDKTMFFPQVDSVDDYPIFHLATQLDRGAESSTVANQRRIIEQDSGASQAFVARNLSFGSNSDLIHRYVENEGSARLSLNPIGENLNINLTIKEESTWQSQQILSLPTQYSVRGLSSTILRAPTFSSDHLTIVLHQEPTMLSSLSTPPADVDPLVIRKDKRALPRRIVKDNLQWRADGTSDTSERPPKRLKFSF